MTEIITKNTEYSISFNFKSDPTTPKDLTGHNILIQIRPYADSDKVLASWTDASPQITFIPISGSVTLSLSPVDTAALDFKAGVMDILAYNSIDGDRSDPIPVTVNYGVSRPA